MSANATTNGVMSIVPQVLSSTKQLHRTNNRFKYVIETGAMGLILMVGLALFGGGSGSPSSAPASSSTASYNPPAQSSPATPPAAPTVTQSQINAIKSQTGGSVISAVPIAPTVIAPSQKEQMTLDPSDLPTKDEAATIRHQDFGPVPESPNHQ